MNLNQSSKVQCAICGYAWTAKTTRPLNCANRSCRSRFWDGSEPHLPNYKHGFTGSGTYRTWQSVKQRCLNPNNPRWLDYGGAGVGIDPQWLQFENFVADMGERPQGKTLDRYPDPRGDYTKSNCRWATPIEQQNNTVSNKLVTYAGQTQTLANWARELSINKSTLAKRLSRGWSVAQALEQI